MESSSWRKDLYRYETERTETEQAQESMPGDAQQKFSHRIRRVTFGSTVSVADHLLMHQLHLVRVRQEG